MRQDVTLDPVMEKDFVEVMNTMSEVFPSINGKARIKYYYNAVKDTPLKCLRDVSKQFLMSAKYMPLPSDFQDAVSDWKKKNNYYKFNPEEAVKIECPRCGDLGILSMHKSEGDFATLVNCTCTNPVAKDLKAPRWSNDLRGGFMVIACPMEWFKPKTVTDFDFQNKEILQLMESWKQKKQSAEKYWGDMGYVHN